MATKTVAYVPRLKQQYKETYREELKNELSLSNINEVPRLEKITINVGVGRKKDDKRFIEQVTSNLRKITGQNPQVVYAKTSIANFKIREKQSKIGVAVTLRGDRAYEMLDRLISVVLPRVRDFQGVKLKAFDKSGNYSIGIKDQSVFAELNFNDTVTIHGLQINIVMDSPSVEASEALLTKFGMPFEKKRSK